MSKTKEWAFKEKRQELINMVKTALEKKINPNMAMDLVDACIVTIWEHYGITDTSEDRPPINIGSAMGQPSEDKSCDNCLTQRTCLDMQDSRDPCKNWQLAYNSNKEKERK